MGQISAAAFQAYDPANAANIVAGPLALYTVNVGSIDPTQLNEGYAEVGKKASAYDLQTAAQVQASLLASIEPVVIGPGGQLYLTDGHHTFTALDDSIFGASNPTVYVNVIANYSNLSTAQFFAQMQSGNLLLPLDNGVAQTVDTTTGAPIPSALTALTNDPYRGLEYSILKNKNSKLFTTTSNITGATGTSTPGLDKMTGFYSDFLEAAAYRTANGGLGLSYLSPGDIALSSQWNLNGASTFTLPNVSGPVTAAQLPGFILSQNLVQGSNITPTVISNATLANGALDGNGTFTGITTINAGTASAPITIGTPNTGFILQMGADSGHTVTLNGNNTYAGGTSILAGTLIITSDAALGAAATGGAIDTTNLKTSVQAANGIIFNSLAEGNGTLQIGTASGAGTSTFTTNRVIAVGSEAATINLNGYLVSLTGQLYSLGTAGVGIGNATGFSDLTIDDTGSAGVLTLATASPNFYGNIIIGNNGKPTVRVMSDAALGATTGSVYEIGQVVLNGGTLQAGASFSANERNITLTSGSTIDIAGFTTSWGSLSDTQRTITIANSGGSSGAITFASFNVASSATLALTGSETTTFTNGIQRSGTASLIIQASAIGSTEKLMSGTGAASLVDGIAQAWIVTNNGVASAAGPYDFVTYGANGYVKATYGSTTLSGSTGTTSVALSANATASGNVAAYALNTGGKTIALGTNTLTIGDGTSADAAGLILASGASITGGTLAFGGSEGVIWLSGSNPTISSTITGSNGLTFNGSGSVALTSAANLSGVVTINSGTVTLGAANVFAGDAAGVLLQDTKSTPAKATLAITANNAFTTLNSAGTNSAVTIATGTTLTIGDTNTNLSSTLSSAISGSGTATIVKAGSGLLDLSGGKVSGVTTISATGGQLRVAVGTSGSVNYALSNNADLQFAQNGGGQYSGAITGAGTLHLIGGTLQLTGTANTYSGGTIVETGSTLDVTTANLSGTNANITDAGGLIVFDQKTSGTYSGVISDGKEMGTGPMLSGSLLKDDSSGGNGGNLTLSSAQTYTGATYVEAGTLTLGVTDAIATSSGVTLGRVGGGATATLALGASETVAALASNASNTTSVTLNGFTLNVAPKTGTTSMFGGTIVDGTAAGKLVKSGAGTLVLSGANTYSGGTTLASGTLDLTKVGAAGSGAITFGTGAQTLDIEQAALNGDGSFTNRLAGFGTGDAIDLRGVGTETSASFDSTTNKLTLSGGTEATVLQLDGAAPTGYGYGLTSDGQGGTLLALDQKATVASLTTSPASGYVKAGQTVSITITTNKAVSISGANPILNLAGGGTATFTGIDATGTQLTFTDTVASGQDASGIQVTSITNAASIQDAAHVAADLSGSVNQTPTGPVIDTTPPSVAITSTAGLTNNTAQTISGTADTPDNSTVTIYETFNGTTKSLGTATVTGGAFSKAVTLSTGDGTHSVYATDTDAAGNTGTSSAVSYDLETSMPSVSLTNTGGLTNQPTQLIVGKVDTSADPRAASSAISITDTSTGQVLATGTTDASGNFSIGVTLSGDGTHALEVQDTDQAHNAGLATVNFTLDTTAPAAPGVALTNDTGTSNADKITNDPSVTVTPSANGDTLLYAADGSTTYTTTQPVFATDGSQDGVHTVSVEEQDPAGNVSAATSITFTLDTLSPAAPSVALTNDTGTSNSDKVTNDPSITYTPSASGDTLLYKADGAATYATTAPTFQGDGSHTVSVVDEDTAGNLSAATTLTFTLDTTADVGGDLAVALPASIGAAAATTASFTVSGLDADAVATVTFTGTGLDGTAKTVSVGETANGTYSVDLSGFKDGSIAAAISATDTAGNHATGTGATGVLDTTADAGGDLAVAFGTANASVSGDVNAAHAAGAAFTVSGLDADATAQVTFSGIGLDGNAKSLTVSETTNGSFTADLTGFKDGTVSAAIQATDAAGNHAVGAGATVTLDTSADVGGDLGIAFGSNAGASGTIDAAHKRAASFTVSGLDSDATATVTFSGTAADGSGAKTVVVSEASNGSYTADLSGFADGRITASIQANDAAGNSANGAGTTAVLDTSANAGGDLAVSFGANAAVSGEINAAHAASAAFSVAGLDADATASVTFTGTALGGGAKTVTVNESADGTYAVDLSGFLDGTVSAAITAHDAAGNSATGTGAVAVLDTTADVGADLAVAFGNNAGTVGEINAAHAAAAAFTVSGLDADATATLTFSGKATDGSAKSVTITENANASGTVDLSGFQDGSVSAAITAIDSAGNSANGHGTTAILDATAPATAAAPTLTAASDSGASASDGVTMVATPTFSGTAEAGATIRLLDSDGTTLGTAVAGASGGYTITTSHLADGTYNVSVTATDAAGNVSAASPATTIIVDTMAPSTPAAPILAAASDSGISSSDRITNVSTPTFAGSAEANSLVKLYDGTTLVGSAVADGTGAYAIVPATRLADGAHTLSVTATDLAGNVSLNSTAVSVTIDTKAPTAPATPTLAAASDSGASTSDGVTNVTTPVVNGIAEAGSTVTLYDTDGTTVLGTAIAASNGAYSITSSTLAEGSHILRVKATDLAGNTSVASGTLTLLLDTTAPARPVAPSLTAASDSGTSSSDAITKVKTPTLTGSAEVGSTVTLFDGSTKLATAIVGATGTYSFTTPALADGAHVFTVTATDLAGNVSATSPATTVTIDTAAPATPAAPTVATTNGTTRSFSPTVTGTAEAASIVTLYDGTKTVGSAMAAANGTYSIEPTTLSEGTHTLKVTATDVAGNISGTSPGTTFTVDAVAPTTPAAPALAASSDSGASSSDHVTNVTTPTVTGRAEAGTTVTLLDSTGAVLGQATASSRGLYSITSTALSDGSHTLSVTSTDSAGNVSAASAGLSVLIDTTPPLQPATPILAASSESGRSSSDAITNDRTPTVTGSAEAGSTVTLYDGSKVVGSAKAAANGAYTITASALVDGVHALTVKATDLAGNISASSSALSVTIDTSAPAAPKAPILTAASDTGASSSDGVTQITTPIFSGTAEAGATIDLYSGGVLLGTATADANGAYTVTSSALKDGVHAFRVTATDAAGNTSGRSAPVTVTIDTTAPATPQAPTLSASSDSGSSTSDGITNVTTPTITGRVEADARVTLYDTDGAILGSVTADRRGNYTITSSTLVEGSHQLTIKTTDVAGNTSAPSAARTILVDTTAPAAPDAPTLAASSDTGTSPSDGITKDTTPTFTGTAEAGSRITLLNGQTVVGTATASAAGVYSVTASRLSSGAHTLTVTATDVAGNVSVASPGTTITIDTTAPARPAAPTLTAASDSGASSKDGITNVTTPVLTGTAEADSIVTLYDRNTIVGTGVAGADGSYAITSSALAAGLHSLHVTATDAAGNVSASSAARSVTIDTSAPKVAITSTGGSVTDATQIVRGTGEAGTTVTLTDDGVNVGTATVGRRGNWSEKVTFSSSGAHNVAATDVDAAGNVGTSNAVAYQYDPATAASLNSLVQAMSTMTPASASSMTPTAPAPAAEHPLAAAHA